MKSTLLFCIITLLQSFAFGHDYFFSFAEVEYNPFTQKLESTIIVEAHDLEYVWQDSELNIDSLEFYTNDSNMLEKVEAYIFDGFKISSNGSYAIFNIVGIDVLLNGTINFYALSEPIELSDSIDITFDLLMDEFEQQQNKVTFIINGESIVASFLLNRRTQRITFEN